MTPRIVVEGAERLVEFLEQVFGATGDYRPDRPAVITIGDSMVMVSEAGTRDPMPAFLYVYVDDVEGTYRQALRAGARALEGPSDTPYGDRSLLALPGHADQVGQGPSAQGAADS